MTREFKVNAAADSAEILVYGTIGDDWDGVSARTFSRQLSDIGPVKSLSVRINSPGGSVSDGFAMMASLASHPATVDTVIDGWAVSAASVLAMAGRTITAAENAILMIHRAWSVAVGNVSDMAKAQEMLAKHDEQIAATYAKRTGKPVEDIEAAMDAETWFTAAEAKEFGLVNEISETVPQASACFDPTAFKYRHAPAAFYEIQKQKNEQPVIESKKNVRARQFFIDTTAWEW